MDRNHSLCARRGIRGSLQRPGETGVGDETMVKAESCGFLNPCERIAFCCMQNAVAGIVCMFFMVSLLEKKIDELPCGGTKLLPVQVLQTYACSEDHPSCGNVKTVDVPRGRDLSNFILMN